MKLIYLFLLFCMQNTAIPDWNKFDFSAHGDEANNLRFSLAMMNCLPDEVVVECVKSKSLFIFDVSIDSLGYAKEYVLINSPETEVAGYWDEYTEIFLKNQDVRYSFAFFNDELPMTEGLKEIYMKLLDSHFKEVGIYEMRLSFPCASMFQFYKEHGYFSREDYLTRLLEDSYSKDCEKYQ